MAPLAAQLRPDDLPDALLEVGVERRSPGHAHRKSGRIADHTPPRAVGERDARDAEPRHLRGRPGVAVVAAGRHVEQAGPERCVAVEAAQLLLERHLLHQAPGDDVVVVPGAHPGDGFGER